MFLFVFFILYTYIIVTCFTKKPFSLCALGFSFFLSFAMVNYDQGELIRSSTVYIKKTKEITHSSQQNLSSHVGKDLVVRSRKSTGLEKLISHVKKTETNIKIVSK